MKFIQSKVNGCNCWDCDDYKIVQHKNGQIFNAYRRAYRKVMEHVKDADGNKTGEVRQTGELMSTDNYTSIKKVVIRKDECTDTNTGEIIIMPVHGPKEYATLEDAKADCV